MAFTKTAQLFIKSLTRPEVIFNNIVKQNIPIATAVNKYLVEIKNLDLHQSDTDIPEFLIFPTSTFYRLNKISLENIVINSYNIFKEKGLCKNANIYNALLETCFSKSIDLDVPCVLRDMTENKVQIDEIVLSNIIKYFTHRGEMDYIEMLLEEMKSKNIQCTHKDKYRIVSGYIIAGQEEKAKIFIIKNKLNMDNHNYFYSRCIGYARIGDVASLKIVLAEMKEHNITLTTRRFLKLYKLLIMENVEKSDLKTIIDLTKDQIVILNGELYFVIEDLNLADKFSFSLFLIENFTDLIDEGYRYIFTFGTSRCPSNIFKQALHILFDRCDTFFYDNSIFGDMNFDVALLISQDFTEKKNWIIIHASLINLAINQKSKLHIEKALKFSKKYLEWKESNTLLFNILPSMKTAGIVSNYDEIIDIFTRFKNDFIPVCHLKYLCSGDFDGYNKLMLKHKKFRNASPMIYVKHLAKDLSENLSLSEIEKWLMEARKCFSEKLIIDILSSLVTFQMVKFLKNEQLDKIDQLILYIKEWNLVLSDISTVLLKAVPEKSEIIQRLIVPKFDDIRNAISSTA